MANQFLVPRPGGTSVQHHHDAATPPIRASRTYLLSITANRLTTTITIRSTGKRLTSISLLSQPLSRDGRQCAQHRAPAGNCAVGHGHLQEFQVTERFSCKFKWEVFNVLNHAMFATSTPAKVKQQQLLVHSLRRRTWIWLNPVLGTGAQRNMQFGVWL